MPKEIALERRIVGIGAPDLVLEILSPRPRIGDLEQRVALFAEYGVREIWLYDQSSRQLTVLGCEGGEVRETTLVGRGPIASAVLPAFRRGVEEIIDDGVE